MSGAGVLRAVANRLTSTSIDELPAQVGYLATSISSCRALLQNGLSSNDHAPLLHKLKTRVSALLQDRSPEGRFCGIVIAKALVEAGGTSILLDSGNWVRAIISCLNKPDPPEVKKLGILTVAHIYLSTTDDQQSVREITLPTLPAFISTTLSIIRPSTSNIENKSIRALSPLLHVVMRAWDALLEHFPSTVRPNSTSMRSICLSLVSDDACSRGTRQAACQVLAKLHYCAPKNTAAIEWAQSCSQFIEAAHDTADLAFRAVIEDWTSATNRITKATRKQKAATTPSTSSSDMAGLDPWSGVSQGCSRIVSQLELLRHFHTGPHSSEVNIPFGTLFDLTSRLSAVTVPTSKYSPRMQNDITRDEREELWLNLPRIHTSILRLYHALVAVFGQALYPLSTSIVSQIWDILESEQAHQPVRAATYQLIASMLESRLLRFSKSDSAHVRLLVKCCCADLSPGNSSSSTQISLTNGNSDASSLIGKNKQGTESGSSKWKGRPITHNDTDLHSSAYALLPALLTYGNLHVLEGSSTVRAQLDSTAIILNHHEAILASVLYPPGSSGSTKNGSKKAAAPSLIPFLARFMTSGLGTDMSNVVRLGCEALLRPRMPVVQTTIESTINLAKDNDYEQEVKSVLNEDVVMLDEDDQPQPQEATLPRTTMKSGNVNISNYTKEATVNLSAPSPPQPISTKRDFTTLLEQSANEQLAASAEDTIGTSMQSARDMLDPISKRPRTIDGETHDGTMYVQGNSLAHPPDPTTEPQMLVANTSNPDNQSTLMATENTKSTTQQPPSSLSHPNIPTGPQIGNDNDDDDDEVSSDSDVPLIDATLVGISDSEDEDEDEDNDQVFQ